jgi:nifR3 family TIM-barrel protein
MQQGFWPKLKKPILAMAPMANVTDAAFRRMFAAIGKPDVFWTEFVSVEGLLSRGREQLLVDFWYSEAERPIVAQVFGDKPEQFEEVAQLVRELGFDGIDINMGCPDSGVEKSGAGAALIRDPARAVEIIRAVKRGAGGDEPGAIPVSVKTRLGYRSTDEMTDWLTTILKEDVAALTVHLRTRNEMSAVPAHWELARSIVELRDKIAPATLILANGDVASLDEANARAAETGVDGVMIGRGMFGNPWFFRADLGGAAPDLREQLERMVEHTELFEKLYRSKPARVDGDGNGAAVATRQLKNFDIMKKHFKAYCSGFDDAKELRIKLMETKNAGEVRRMVEEFLVERKMEE